MAKRRHTESAGCGFLTVGQTARIPRVAAHGRRGFNPGDTEAALLRIDTPPAC